MTWTPNATCSIVGANLCTPVKEHKVETAQHSTCQWVHYPYDRYIGMYQDLLMLFKNYCGRSNEHFMARRIGRVSTWGMTGTIMSLFGECPLSHALIKRYFLAGILLEFTMRPDRQITRLS